MKKINKIIHCILIYITLTIISCDVNNKEKIVNKQAKIVSNSKLLKGWKSIDQDTLRVNIPVEWNPKAIKDALLYIPLEKNESNLYYVILNYSTTKINYKDYVKEVFKQIYEKDKNFRYTLKKVTFKNNNSCYILQMFTKENNVKYKIYSLIYRVNNDIYDFSFKTLDNKKVNPKNYEIFYNVLFSFEYKHDNIIDSEKFIIDKEQLLDYNNL